MLKVSHKQNKKYAQKFTVFTEESWTENKKNYPKNADHFFSGKKNEFFVDASQETVQYFIGIGKASFQNFEVQEAASKFAYSYRKNFLKETTFIDAEILDREQFEELIKGLFLGTYQYSEKQDHPFWDKKFAIHTQTFSQKILDETMLRANAVCEGQFAAMNWLNKPQNRKRVSHITSYLKEISEKYGFKITFLNRKEAEKAGLGAFLAVNQGSSQEAAFTIIEYRSGKKNAKKVGLVGKCVLFDTGGISIKPSSNLHYMKSDMGGATAVIGTLIAAAEMKLGVDITAVLPITDNAVSNSAYTPSDVIKAYNGKTIEVLDTDAEGRMTLADGLSYLSKNFKTDFLIDLATLTGSSVRMFGYTCAAYFSNSESLKKSLENSADATNQRIWNLPLWDVWKDDFRSDVADFKNISAKPFGDCIVAAKFLEQFTENHPNWAHLDIAGVAFGNVQYMKEKGATGYGVQLLLDFMQKID